MVKGQTSMYNQILFTNYKLKVAVNLMVAWTLNIACLFLMTP